MNYKFKTQPSKINHEIKVGILSDDNRTSDISELFLRHIDYELVDGVLRPSKNALQSFDSTRRIISAIQGE